MHAIVKKMRGFCFYSQIQRWRGFDLMTSASMRKTSREKVVSGKFHTTFEGGWYLAEGQRFHRSRDTWPWHYLKTTFISRVIVRMKDSQRNGCDP